MMSQSIEGSHNAVDLQYGIPTQRKIDSFGEERDSPHAKGIFERKQTFSKDHLLFDSLLNIMIPHTLIRCTWRLSSKNHREFASRYISSTNRTFLPTHGPGGNLLHQQSDTAQLRLQHSVEPIPYTDGFELTPVNLPTDYLGHKKVTIVGCGQVGMAIAFAMLNQVIAGTIALVDVNKEKLEGEAKDLEQGSAFHQYVRILASDQYVRMIGGQR